ncbi:hypothetical protein JTB14_008730 [Gonioctena quinquepunctata]|nr:hypothetical protein JTB14_008730 [Gonioctena quinquepunctata]
MIAKQIKSIPFRLHILEQELQAALFLHSCYYSNELAKNTIDTYFTVKTLYSDIFGARNPRDIQLELAMDYLLVQPLPKHCPDGELVIFIKLMDNNPDLYNFPVTIKVFDMITLLHVHQNAPSSGTMIVFDMEGISFSHFLKVNLVTLRKFMHYLQDAMPIRLKGLHFYNIVSFMDKVMALIRPLLKKELTDSIFLHSSVDSLYSHVPKDILPQEYGGTSESLKISQEKYRAQLNDHESFFKYQDSQLVDESKRIGNTREIDNKFGMEGTFKRLEID